ncbi:MAG: ATP-binding protein [Tannerellaceae bacterium]|nr:ATP-binding protein [Tannerellaceae bacterium]
MEDELKKRIDYLEMQLKNQDRLASLGLLSAGIAHEIQNPLNFVINFSKLSSKLLNDLEDLLQEIDDRIPEKQKEELEEILEDLSGNMTKIKENGDRASSIVRNVLLHARGKEDEFILTNLKKLIKEYVWLAYHAVRSNNKSFNVCIEEDYAEDVPEVKVVPQDFSRAVLNIMNNACYAVYGKSKRALPEPYQPTVKVRLWKEDDWVKLSVEDNGPGIAEEVIPKLFKPFYTTKPVGEGTGLGLSITKSIVEDKHYGKVEVDTKLNEFTRFTISLPVKK